MFDASIIIYIARYFTETIYFFLLFKKVCKLTCIFCVRVSNIHFMIGQVHTSCIAFLADLNGV